MRIGELVKQMGLEPILVGQTFVEQTSVGQASVPASFFVAPASVPVSFVEQVSVPASARPYLKGEDFWQML